MWREDEGKIAGIDRICCVSSLKIRIEPVEISSVLPSHGLHRSTIDDEGLNFRVRNGTGCTSLSMATELNGLYSVLKCCTLKAA